VSNIQLNIGLIALPAAVKGSGAPRWHRAALWSVRTGLCLDQTVIIPRPATRRMPRPIKPPKTPELAAAEATVQERLAARDYAGAARGRRVRGESQT